MRINRQLQLLALVAITACLVTWFPNEVNAASVKQARITRVNNHVQLLHSTTTARPASVNDIVEEGTVIRTGSSAMLIQSPKGANDATIHAATGSAAITGTTAMLEYRPGVYKFLVLEGTGRLYRPGHLGDSVLVGPGQLVMGNPNAAVSDPVDFDIARFVKTSRFMVDLPPLRSEKLIAAESQKQQQEKSKKTLIDTNLVIFGGGTRVSVLGQPQTNIAGRTTAGSAKPHSMPEATGAAQQ